MDMVDMFLFVIDTLFSIAGVVLVTLVIFFLVRVSRTWDYNPNARSQNAYFSTPEHAASFIGQVVWIYTGNGTITLDPDAVILESNRISRRIPFNEIVGLHVGRHSRLAKPITLKHIEFSYRDGDDVQTVLLTPTVSWLAPVWETNKVVEIWADRLQQARAQAA